MVLIEYRRSSPEQIFVVELWISISDILDNVSHDSLCCPELFVHRVLENRAVSEDQI